MPQPGVQPRAQRGPATNRSTPPTSRIFASKYPSRLFGSACRACTRARVSANHAAWPARSSIGGAKTAPVPAEASQKSRLRNRSFWYVDQVARIRKIGRGYLALQARDVTLRSWTRTAAGPRPAAPHLIEGLRALPSRLVAASAMPCKVVVPIDRERREPTDDPEPAHRTPSPAAFRRRRAPRHSA